MFVVCCVLFAVCCLLGMFVVAIVAISICLQPQSSSL